MAIFRQLTYGRHNARDLCEEFQSKLFAKPAKGWGKLFRAGAKVRPPKGALTNDARYPVLISHVEMDASKKLDTRVGLLPPLRISSKRQK
jgi:hypothetical protein